MKNNKTLIMLVSFVMLLNSVFALFTQGAANNPICSTGSQTLAASQLDPGVTTPDFDYTSSYYDNNTGDSIPLFVSKADPNSNKQWEFVRFTSDLGASSKGYSSLPDTKTYTYVKLVNQFLFLKDASNLYMYKLGGGKQTIALPTGYDVNGAIMPFYSRADGTGFRVYIALTDGQSTSVYYWAISSTGVINSADQGTLVGAKITHGMSSISGTGQIIYDNVARSVLIAAGTSWNPVNIGNGPITFATTNPKVKIYTFQNSRGMISIQQTNSTGTTNRLYTIQGSSVQSYLSYSTNAQTSPYRFFYDDVRNFVITTSQQLSWVHVKSDAAGTMISNDIYQIDYNITDIGLSGNKMALLYNTASKNQVAYYRVLSSGVQHLWNMNFDKTVLVTTGDNYQYKLNVACSCEDLQRFTCFSSTLNCIIVKKALGSCKGTDSTYAGTY